MTETAQKIEQIFKTVVESDYRARPDMPVCPVCGGTLKLDVEGHWIKMPVAFCRGHEVSWCEWEGSCGFRVEGKEDKTAMVLAIKRHRLGGQRPGRRRDGDGPMGGIGRAMQEIE